MRLYEINSENESPRNFLNTVMAKCSPFLQAIGGPKNLYKNVIYRGDNNSNTNKTYRTIQCPLNRPPRDTPLVFHNLIDEWFYESTGVRFRSNALFGSGRSMQALHYGAGNAEAVIPIGEFHYAWSPNVYDLTKMIDRFEYKDNDTDETFIESLMEYGDYQFDADLVKAIKFENEIMINCAEAFLVNIGFLKSMRGSRATL